MKNIEAKAFSQMLISGANNLANNKQSVNELNVFPVPDGDTGTNMSLTVSAMVKALEECKFSNVSDVANTAANATLRGARGNSGVILSQFMRGLAKELKKQNVCSANMLAAGLKEGSDAAYRAVMNPTEGTILTVAREAANGAVLCDSEDMCEMMRACVKRGNTALKKTTQMLEALKKAGVVDAGGQGWMHILEGMLYYLENGKIIELSESEKSISAPKAVALESKEKPEHIKFGYCTEFIIEKKSKSNLLLFKNSIENIGDCMLVIDDDEVVKVHIHTNHPGTVIENALKMGELINIKIDNMRHQHNSIIENEKKQEPAKKYGFAAVAAGDGFAEILKDMGVDTIIEGGQTMNPSTEDILKAAESINAENIFIFPNNKNIIMAAEQAASVSEKNIIVIPTRSIPSAISAMLEFNAEKEADENTEIMKNALDNADVAQVTYAVRDVEEDNIHEGDIIAIHASKIEVSGTDRKTVTENIIKKMLSDDSEFVTIYYGEDATEDEAQEIADNIENEFEDVEVSVKYGGQSVYYYIISAE